MSKITSASPEDDDFDPSQLAAAEREVLLLKLLQSLAPDAKARIVGTADLKSNRPYYNERVAMELLELVDGMIKDKREVLFPYITFFENNGWTDNTLYLYVQQGLDWLKDNYDPDKDCRYSEFRDSISITKRKNDTGVRLLWKDFVKSKNKKGGLFAGAVRLGDEVDTSKWKEELMSWMGNPFGPPVFKKEGLGLSEADIELVRNLLKDAEGRYYVVQLDTSTIKLGRE
jgi:hypothetical protein